MAVDKITLILGIVTGRTAQYLSLTFPKEQQRTIWMPCLKMWVSFNVACGLHWLWPVWNHSRDQVNSCELCNDCCDCRIPWPCEYRNSCGWPSLSSPLCRRVCLQLSQRIRSVYKDLQSRYTSHGARRYILQISQKTWMMAQWGNYSARCVQYFTHRGYIRSLVRI